MTYNQFSRKVTPGTTVQSNERVGTVTKISKDQDKALVRFKDGYTEWIEFYKIELYATKEITTR